VEIFEDAVFQDFLIEGDAMNFFDVSSENGVILVATSFVADNEHIPKLAEAM